MTSIRTRLFLILVTTTSLLWLSAIAWIFFSTRAEVEHVLDARLTEAARMVSSLLVSQDVDPKRAAQLGTGATTPHNTYGRQLSCQIWSLDGTLVGRTNDAPAAPLSKHHSGFAETTIDGDVWRVYAVENTELGVRVLVGDNVRVRDRLVGDVIKGLLLPASLIMPLLAGLIWVCLRQGLAPLNRMAASLAKRDASDLSALPMDDRPPAEIRPVVSSLNGLFAKLARARERERNFTAFAAHELRTPLAGLKTQAQIALGSSDGNAVRTALGHIVLGVDRTSRLVRQLLDMAEVEASERMAIDPVVNIGRMLEAIGKDLLMHGRHQAALDVDSALHAIEVTMAPELFTLAARNLIENALLHSPSAGVVRCRMSRDETSVGILIEDEGPGIPDDEIPRVRERFFRGSHKSAVGSGLGLSIVEAALSRGGAKLVLANRPERGLCATIVVATSQVREVPPSNPDTAVAA